MAVHTKSLDGKTALVTGGSRNLGRAIAMRLAAAGALVAINYASNDASALETLAAIEREGGQAFLVRQRIGTAEDGDALQGALIPELQRRTGGGGLDILVNNVGGDGYGAISDVTTQRFDEIMMLNVGSTFFVTKALMPHLNNGGRVINISSAASRLALPSAVVYSMAKAAIDSFTQVMAKELGLRGITVNAVLPGYNETDANAEEMSDPEARKAIEDMTLLGRFGQPRDIADCVHALASDDMRWVTGAIIEASGGFKF